MKFYCFVLAFALLQFGDALIKRDGKTKSNDEPGTEEPKTERSKVMTGYRAAPRPDLEQPTPVPEKEPMNASINASNVDGEGPGYISTTKQFQQERDEMEAEKSSQYFRVGTQLLWGLVYYFLVVRKYPMVTEPPTERAKEIQDQNEVSATLDVSVSNFVLSWLCTGPRGAHTFHALGEMNYFLGCILMSACPCCTLWYMNTRTDVNAKLGGEKRGCCMGFICACCCTQCVVAQDAESMDAISLTNTRLCGVVPHKHKPDQQTMKNQ